MTDLEILSAIDRGANHYIELFGMAKHMRLEDFGAYRTVRPAPGQYGITFAFDIKLENANAQTRNARIAEIKALGIPVWLSLLADDDLFLRVFGREKTYGQTAFAENDEAYMALLPGERAPAAPPAARVERVESAEEFALWAGIANHLLHDDKRDLDPVNHFPLCEKGLIRPYIAYDAGAPAAIASAMGAQGAYSLEFVATLPQKRRQGFARAACQTALADAFRNGARIVTLRAINRRAASLYASLGFRAYNFAM